ncbi:hypothetical protein [Flavobacterium celericrescens]|uniref:Lipoprotein n=1 Tax=Flavobacterium celericrescens TaxID=2709780 RepID=A0ABX0IDB8_9FLAO|nr:hypothetical protein [Flavobacterium celericrescens]NHM05205.1 hypothetical protein [Flavobacterium celericrescens]
MTKKIYSFLLFILLLSCANEKKCSDFKTGNFIYVNPNFSDWKVTRNDSIQTETNIANGLEVSGKITWKSDCEFEVAYVKTNHPKLQKMIGKKVEIKIIGISNDTITYEAKDENLKMESKMVKVK